MTCLTLSKNSLTLDFAGLMSNLSLYLRTLKPRKSKPLFMCDISVFCSNSSRPLVARNMATKGLTSFSRSFFVTPVMMKSSAYLTKWTLCWRLKCYLNKPSNPSKAILASVGEIIPPCGVPSRVGLYDSFSMQPAFNHPLSFLLFIGMLSNIH